MTAPTPSSPEPQTLDLADFTPGIYSRLTSVIEQFPVKDGAAQASQTFNCFALPDGGLAPCPRVSFFRTAGDPDIDPPSTTPPAIWTFPTGPSYPASYNRIAVLDAHLVSPVERVPPLTDSIDTTLPAVDLFTVRQWYLIDSNSPTHILVVHRFRGHPVYSGNTSNTYAFKDLYSLDYLDPLIMHPSRWRYGWGSITETRTQYDTIDTTATFSPLSYPGSPVVVAVMGAIIKVSEINDDGTLLAEGIDSGQYLSYPDYHEGNEDDPLDPYAVLHDAVYIIPSPLSVAFPAIIFGHQGRLANTTRKSGWSVARRDYFHGNHDGYRGEEIIDYFTVNGIYNNPNGPFRGVYMEEVTAGIGSVHSVNANTLLLVKHRGGAVLVTGDLDRPQVTRLPGIPSTGGLANRGAMTDQGYAYGTASGVWMWAGSDSATCISPQLDPNAWVPDDPTIPRREIEQLVGSFAYRYPYLYAPNNWMFDFRTGGWFRYFPTPDQIPATLDDDGVYTSGGAIFAYNQAAHDGNLWAVVPSYEVDGLFFAEFDQNTGTNFYSWQSQPLNKSRNRRLTFQSCTIVASGMGRVQVTVAGLPLPDAPDPVTFDLTNGGIDMATQPIHVQAMDVIVTITSQAHDPDLPAPIIHRVSFTYIEDVSLGQAGTS